MRISNDLIGQIFGRLKVVGRAERTKCRHARWNCVCDCGEMSVVQARYLTSGEISSCGCGNTTHGMYGTPTYTSWAHMKDRCNNPGSDGYMYYGGRGVSVCSRWANSFEAFFEDMGERPNLKTIDRIDNDGNYDPVNCRWASTTEQARSRGTTRLTIDDVRSIRVDGRLQKTIALQYGVSSSHISAIRSNKVWLEENDNA